MNKFHVPPVVADSTNNNDHAQCNDTQNLSCFQTLLGMTDSICDRAVHVDLQKTLVDHLWALTVEQ